MLAKSDACNYARYVLKESGSLAPNAAAYLEAAAGARKRSSSEALVHTAGLRACAVICKLQTCYLVDFPRQVSIEAAETGQLKL